MGRREVEGTSVCASTEREKGEEREGREPVPCASVPIRCTFVCSGSLHPWVYVRPPVFCVPLNFITKCTKFMLHSGFYYFMQAMCTCMYLVVLLCLQVCEVI